MGHQDTEHAVGSADDSHVDGVSMWNFDKFIWQHGEIGLKANEVVQFSGTGHILRFPFLLVCFQRLNRLYLHLSLRIQKRCYAVL